jgi:hypothetical protein
MSYSNCSLGRTRVDPWMQRARPVHHARLRCRATENAVAEPTSPDKAIETLKQAAGKIKSIDKIAAKDVFKSLRQLQKSQLKVAPPFTLKLVLM